MNPGEPESWEKRVLQEKDRDVKQKTVDRGMTSMLLFQRSI